MFPRPIPRIARCSRFLILPMVMVLHAVPAAAAESHPCAAIVVPAERLACYDRAYPVAPSVAEATKQQSIDDFGRGDAALKRAAEIANAAPPRIESRIVKVDRSDDRSPIIELDNGQIWALAVQGDAQYVEEGTVVALKRGAFSSYILVTPSGIQLKVKRLR